MPTKKSSTRSPAEIPKGWPADDVAFLSKPTFSRHISVHAVHALRRPPKSGVVLFSARPGPCTQVRIHTIEKPRHPANGQHGLFAAHHLPSDGFILLYLGFVHTQQEADPTSNYDLSLDRDLGLGVDATKMGNEARFINDYRGIAQSPNAEFRDVWVQVSKGIPEKYVAVYALPAGKSGKRAKGIAKGEEILVSYGKSFWKERQCQEGEQPPEE